MGSFGFESAEEVFRQFFGNRGARGGFFDDDDDFFGDAFGFSGFGGKSNKNKGTKKTNNSRDPFAGFFGRGGLGGGFGFGDDDFFGGDMFSGGMGMGTSISKSTIIKNGKKVTVTKTTKTQPDGSVKTEVIEETDDGRGNVTKKQFLEGGQCKNGPSKIRYK